jgi:hypothetical protein
MPRAPPPTGQQTVVEETSALHSPDGRIDHVRPLFDTTHVADSCWQPHPRADRPNASSHGHNASACALAFAVEDADRQRRASATMP